MKKMKIIEQKYRTMDLSYIKSHFLCTWVSSFIAKHLNLKYNQQAVNGEDNKYKD